MNDAEKPFGFPGAGVRAGNVRQTQPGPGPWPAADWGLWADMPRATLREAVLLSLDLEPRPTRATRNGYASPEWSEPGPEFHRRLTLACAYVGCEGPLRAVILIQLMGPREAVEVNLPAFREWADGMGWPMPEAFPGASARAPGAAVSARHNLKRRADPLSAVLAEAKRQALDPADWLSVWAALVKLAESVSRPAPLLGYVDDEGVKYRTDDAAQPAKFLTKEAFRRRFGRS